MSNPFDALSGMGGMGGIGAMIGQMQQQMKAKQLEAEAMVHIGEAGGGRVKVSVKGSLEIIDITIDQSLNEDLDMIEDLILVATNNGLAKAKDYMQTSMSEVTAGLPIPPGMLGF